MDAKEKETLAPRLGETMRKLSTVTHERDDCGTENAHLHLQAEANAIKIARLTSEIGELLCENTRLQKAEGEYIMENTIRRAQRNNQQPTFLAKTRGGEASSPNPTGLRRPIPPKKRQRRGARPSACTVCFEAKRTCDKGRPCSFCVVSGAPNLCKYIRKGRDPDAGMVLVPA
ncbi:hypothetical protein BU16DRAFT_543658 [Lophium mytilinum]|uniref:Zn(2)-C6 fungal-type domain-containing protein n=1 Tax=Lophium mytilinum TaxID=390894 RepID=A0A6A6QDV1_9PEZI|nr:hypothetical protein BU16DRAFT_543658 [Lophium mytilinum]